MKLLLTLATIALLAVPAMAGETCDGACPLTGQPTADGGTSLDGFECQNHCPLAQRANHHRSLGLEARVASKAMRAHAAQTVARGLSKI